MGTDEQNMMDDITEIGRQMPDEEWSDFELRQTAAAAVEEMALRIARLNRINNVLAAKITRDQAKRKPEPSAPDE